MTRTREDEARLHRPRKLACLLRDLLLVFSREIDKVVVLCAYQERDRCLPITQWLEREGRRGKGEANLVEAPGLPVPFLDAVEGALTCEVEHEQNCDGVVAHERKHIHEFPLAAEVPDRECDFSIAD